MGGGGAASPGGKYPQPRPLTGYFGVKGRSGDSSVRHWVGDVKDARRMFDSLTSGYVREVKLDDGTIIRYMPDGQTITFRPHSSSDGTPTIQIVGRGRNKPQKIHFVPQLARN